MPPKYKKLKTTNKMIKEKPVPKIKPKKKLKTNYIGE